MNESNRPAAGQATAAEAAPGPGVADCGMCNGKGFYGSPGQRCGFCRGTGKVKFWRPADDTAPCLPDGQVDALLAEVGRRGGVPGIPLDALRTFVRDVLAASEKLGLAPQQVVPDANLVQRCKDLLTLDETGVLPQGAIREMAAADIYNDGAGLSRAQARTRSDALRFVVAAGCALSDALVKKETP